MKLLCEGYTSEIQRLLRGAPDEPRYLDSKEFYFGMFIRLKMNINKFYFILLYCHF